MSQTLTKRNHPTESWLKKEEKKRETGQKELESGREKKHSKYRIHNANKYNLV